MISTTGTVKNHTPVLGNLDFSADFKIDNISDVHVFYVDDLGVETELTYSDSPSDETEFSVDTLTDSGFMIHLGSTGYDGGTLSIRRTVELVQETHWPTGGDFPATSHERAADRLMMAVQQLKEELNRVVRTSLADNETALVIPSLVDRINGVLAFDENGDIIMREGFMPKHYDNDYNYATDSIVQYDGEFWICLSPCTGIIPGTNYTYWEKYLSRISNWDSGIFYVDKDVVFHQGIIYVATSLSNNRNKEPGVETAYWTEMNIYGTRWDPDVDYLEDDITSYNGVLIKAVQDNKGQTPDINPGGDTTYWEVVETGGAVKVNGVVGTDSISQFDLVYFDNGTDDGDNPADAGKLVVADKRYLDKAIISGFATTGGTSGDTIQVQSKGKLTGFPASSFTAGNKYYLGNNGAFCTKGDIDWQEYIVFVGVAIDDTTLDVNIQMPEPTTKQDDGTPIGGIRYFSTYKDRSAYGYLSFDFDNAISQANYPKLFEEIGHLYNDQHVAAGDADLSGSSTLFYPTPVPGAYDRVAIPDYEFTNSDVVNTSGYLTFNISGARASFRHGIPFIFKVVSGTAPTGMTDGQLYYVRWFSNAVLLYNTENDAIIDGTKIAYTDSGSGTFRLTQEGINLDDAFQGHFAQYHHNAVTADNGNNGQINDATQAGSYWNATDTKSLNLISDGSNGTPRTTNETRPKTNFLYGYIKAEYVTTAGESISALRYDTGWVNSDYDWEGKTFTVEHNLNTPIDGLVVDFYYDSGSYKRLITGGSNYNSNVTAGNDYGVSIKDDTADPLNSINIQIGVNGFLTLGLTSFTYIDNNDPGYYKVVITKPNLVSTVFDVSSLPKTYDLTSGDVTVTLPEITGVMQTKSIYWKNGGTYKLTLTVTDGATIGGETASTWEGEGEGHILLESDGSNWQVREYEDSGSCANIGNGTNEHDHINRTWEKKRDKTLIQRGLFTDLPHTSNYYSIITIDLIFCKSFADTSYLIRATMADKVQANREYTIYRSRANTVDSPYLSYAEIEHNVGDGSSVVKLTYEAVGKWA